MSDFHDVGDHYDLGGSHHDSGAHHLGGHYGAHQGGEGGQGIMGVLNHFLGNDVSHTDPGHQNHSHHNHAGSTDPAHVQTTDTLTGSKWGQFFSGLPVTPSMMFATLFGGMVLWLGVVYLLSHNNGPGDVVRRQPTQADQILLSGTRNAMPVPQRLNYAQYSPAGTPAVVDQGPPNGTLISALPGAIEARTLPPAQVTAQASPMPYTINQGVSEHYPDVRSYRVNVQSVDGTRQRTIVNR
jgi:hypothetical protein